MKKVLVINTGGTIGMVHIEKGNPLSPLKPAEDWGEIAANYPLLNNFDTGYIQLEELIDSSDMNPKIWIEVAKIIEDNYSKYSGFVVLHGTDTMAFTASALSFMLKNLSKPVILTGSQVPLENPRSDALQNLVTAIQIAGSEQYNITLVPEVCIFFRDHLLRGNRSRKLDATNYYGFSSPNYSNLGIAGSEIKINKARIRKPSTKKFYVDYSMDTNVVVFDIFPGFNPEILRTIFKNSNINGLILKTYGNGNAPTSEAFIDVIKEIIDKGVAVVNITQCPVGMVKMGLYEASTRLLDAGVISGMDLTPEAAISKLMHLLGKGLTKEEITRAIQIDICGEQSLDLLSYFLDSSSSNVTNKTFEITLPENIDPNKIKSTRFRIRNISSNKPVELSVKISGEEPLELTNSIKTLKRDGEVADFLTSFDHSTREILAHGNKLIFTLDSKEEISYHRIVFEMFIDKY
jgi:L-asparaginase